MYPDPKDAQSALDSGRVHVSEFDPDGDAITRNHDEAPVDDATDAAASATTGGAVAHDGGEDPVSAPPAADGEATTAGATRASRFRGRAPGTHPNPALAQLLAVAAALSATLGGAARLTREG